MEWIEDEQIVLAASGEKLTQTGFERIQSLFEKATKDYLSVNVWLKAADYMELALVESLEAMQSSDREDPPQVLFDTVRAFYESAVEHLEGHLSRAGEIWARYRGFEELAASVADASEEVAGVERKRALFHRELAQPHKHLQKMYDEEYLPWERTVGDAKAPANDESHAQVLKLLGTSLEEYRRRQEHETILQEIEAAYEENHTPDYTKLDALRKYLRYEQSHSPNSSGRVTCLYERILAIYFLTLDIWQSYSQTLLKAPSKHSDPLLKLETAINVQRRAVRNYPYTHHMWCQLMLTLEQYGALNGRKEDLKTEITQVFDKALEAGLHSGNEYLAVYLQFLDYRIRAVTNWEDETQTGPIRSVLESSRSYFEAYLPDQLFAIEEYWANMAATKMQNVDAGREVFETALKRDPSSSRHWIAFVRFEQLQMQTERARELYKRAIAVPNLNSPEQLWSQWIDFERVFGTLESYVFASEKIEKRERELMIKNAASAAQQEAALAAADEELGPRKNGRKQQKSASQSNNTPTKNRKMAKASNGEAVATSRKDRSKNKEEGGNSAVGSHQENLASRKHAPNYDPVTLHVSGLPTTPELLESITIEQISALFDSFGAIVDIRFPLQPQTGGRKGFVYVQFADAAASKAVRAAIKSENRKFVLELPVGTEVHQYPLRVSSAVASKPHRERREKKAPIEGLEEYKHTVFVSGLSTLTTLAKLETFLTSSGAPAPVAIRMPTDRKSGLSRCIAYLDFDNESLVHDAVTALNDKLLDGRRIKAAPSAPTKERTPHPPAQPTQPTPLVAAGVGALGGKAAQEAEKHAATLTSQPKLVPRSVALRGPASGGPKARIAPLSKPQSSKMDTS